MFARVFTRAFPRLLACVLLACPTLAQSNSITVTDACGKSLAGGVATGSAAVSVDSAGSVTVAGFASGYTAGVGQCDLATADNKPRCTLSASRTATEMGATGVVTLYAKCSSSPANFTWNLPSSGASVPSPNPTTANSIDVTFTKAGAFTYSVVGTSSTAGAGPASAPVTILVSDPATANEVPTCLVTFSPVSVVFGGASQADAKSTGRVVCHPQATTYEWDPAETNAPGMPAGSASAELTFSVAGTYTYKVRGKTATSAFGPKASATVTATSGGTGCTDGPVNGLGVAPDRFTWGPDLMSYPNYVYALSFTAPAGITTFMIYQHSAYTTYYIPVMTWSLSKCKGDFNPPTGCKATFGTYGGIWGITTVPTGGACLLNAGEQYYLNMKQESCSGPNGCGFEVYHER